MIVTGTIQNIELSVVPSKFQGEPGRSVTKVFVDVERAVDDRGEPIPDYNLIGHFEGVAELSEQYSAGQKVRIVTTAPLSMHIETISALD